MKVMFGILNRIIEILWFYYSYYVKEDIVVTEATKELLSREEVPEELTWRLEDIFATDEKWEEEYESLQTDIPKVSDYRGKLAQSSETLYSLFALQDKLSERLGKLYTYAR